jgi:SPP1 gp7 family putative phage head morphogenesis protein
MIQNLAGYNAWKRSTLNRLTSKYRRLALKVFEHNLKSHESAIIYALENNSKMFPLNLATLDHQLIPIFMNHIKETIHVGVSDGMREVTPDNKLSTWQAWPYDYPVEKTITLMGEKKVRDSVTGAVIDFLFKGKKKKELDRSILEVLRLEKQRYRKNIEVQFKRIAGMFYEDPDNTSPRSAFVDLLKTSLGKTESSVETIFRTETTRYFNESRIAYFKGHTSTDFVQLMAITDGRISEICESRDKYVIPIGQCGLNKFKPPFHPNCRTVQSPLNTATRSAQAVVRENLGSEFGEVKSESSDLEFTGKRKPPNIPLPKGWG